MQSNDEALAAALKNQRLTQAILDTTVDPIIVIDEHGIIEEANQATTTLLGHERPALIGQNVSMLMPEPFRSEHDGYLQQYLRTGEARIIGIGRDVVAQRADGSEFPMLLSVSEVVSEIGGHRRFTGVIHDLTDRVAAEQALHEANKTLEARVESRTTELRSLLVELERSNRDLEQFAYIASHDLQTPLRNVRQGLELLDEHLEETTGSGFDDEATELRRLISAAVVRMEALIDGLLSFSRVDKRADAGSDAVDLNAVAHEVRQLFALDLEEANIDLHIGPLPTVSGDRSQLRQLFQNLLQNAVKYRTQDEDPKITVEGAEENGEWVISIGDNGIGIDPKQHERIFDLFRRGHSGYDGVGLGLAIAQRIVERHDGRIWVESEAGQGATFHIALPQDDDS